MAANVARAVQAIISPFGLAGAARDAQNDEITKQRNLENEQRDLIDGQEKELADIQKTKEAKDKMARDLTAAKKKGAAISGRAGTLLGVLNPASSAAPKTKTLLGE